MEPQLVTAHRVRTGAPEAEQLKDTKSEPIKALHTLRYRPLLCGTGAELGDRGLLRWQQVPPALTDCSPRCWWCQRGPSWVTQRVRVA